MLPDFRVRQRDELLEINRLISEELELSAVLARILRAASQLLSSHAGLVALHEGAGGGWRIAASHGIRSEFLRELDPLLADIPDHGDPARFALPEVNRRLQRITRAATMGLLNGVGLPLIAHNRVIGVIFVFRSYSGTFSTEDRRLLQAFAAQAAIAVSNASLYTEVNRQNQHLDAILESSADGILLLDPQHRIQRFNRACTRLTGWPAEQVVGQRQEDILRWMRREPGPSLEEAEAGGWPLSAQATLYLEGDLRRRDGGVVSLGITYAPVLGPEGRLVSIIANLRDIARFREAEELKSTFISIVSHELRTPVALIKGYVGTLRRDDARWDPAVIRDSLEVIEEEADRLSGLIDDLLDASRLQAGALSLETAETQLAPLLRRLVERYRAQSPGHELKAEVPDDLPLVQADEARLTQVVTNLLSNAVKYSPEGRVVTLRAEARPAEIVVCVTDSGPGIDPADVPHVFDRFYRSPEVSRNTKGAGLGLFLARAIVEAHGGRIWVDPRSRQGARVCFSLPRT